MHVNLKYVLFSLKFKALCLEIHLTVQKLN